MYLRYTILRARIGHHPKNQYANYHFIWVSCSFAGVETARLEGHLVYSVRLCHHKSQSLERSPSAIKDYVVKTKIERSHV